MSSAPTEREPRRRPAGRAHADARPAVPWVESEALDGHLDAISADVETRRFCHELAEVGLATLDLGDEGRRLIDRVRSETDPYFRDASVARVQDLWLRSRAVQRLATVPKLMDMLTAAYGRRAFAFQTLSFHRGTEQALHSDAVHFHSEPPKFMCGVWIALEDISPASGPLQYVAGSHKLPVMTMQDAGVNQPQPGPQDYARYYIPALHARLAASGLPTRVSLPRKGQAIVWAANLAHGGSAIAEPTSTRRSLVVHVYFEDCLYYTPMTSDPAQGRYQTRLPMNVRTGGWVWPRRDGRRVAAPRGAIVDALLHRIARRPIVQRLDPAPHTA